MCVCVCVCVCVCACVRVYVYVYVCMIQRNCITRDPTLVRAGAERQPAGTLGYRTVPVIFIDD